MPVGFDGLLSRRYLVFGPTASRTCCGVSLKFCARGHEMGLGTAPGIRIISGYDTQYGDANTTSSPGPSVAMNRLNKLCLAPHETITCARAMEMPWKPDSSFAAASRSAGNPATGA